MDGSTFTQILRTCLLPSIFITGTLQAQSSGEDPGAASRMIAITEVGFSYRMNSYAEDTFNLKRRQYFTSEVGLMEKLNRHFAWGGNLFIGMDEGGEFRVGVKLRFRRRLIRKVSIDFGPGLLIWDTRPATDPTLIGSVALDFRNVIALTAQVEHVRTNFPGGTDTAFYVGLRLGAKPGVMLNSVAGGIAAVVGILFLLAGGSE